MKVKFIVNSCTATQIDTKAGKVTVYNLNLIARRTITKDGLKQVQAESFFFRNAEAIEVGKELTLNIQDFDVRVSTTPDQNDPSVMRTFKWLRFKGVEATTPVAAPAVEAQGAAIA